METKDTKICPIMSKNIGGGVVKCQTEECQMWVNYKVARRYKVDEVGFCGLQNYHKE